jgi:hypothetical protein
MKTTKDEIKKLLGKISLPKKIPFKELPKHLTGISTPVFGFSWKPPESERKSIRELIIF